MAFLTFTSLIGLLKFFILFRDRFRTIFFGWLLTPVTANGVDVVVVVSGGGGCVPFDMIQLLLFPFTCSFHLMRGGKDVSPVCSSLL